MNKVCYICKVIAIIIISLWFCGRLDFHVLGNICVQIKKTYFEKHSKRNIFFKFKVVIRANLIGHGGHNRDDFFFFFKECFKCSY